MRPLRWLATRARTGKARWQSSADPQRSSDQSTLKMHIVAPDLETSAVDWKALGPASARLATKGNGSSPRTPRSQENSVSRLPNHECHQDSKSWHTCSHTSANLLAECLEASTGSLRIASPRTALRIVGEPAASKQKVPGLALSVHRNP